MRLRAWLNRTARQALIVCSLDEVHNKDKQWTCLWLWRANTDVNNIWPFRGAILHVIIEPHRWPYLSTTEPRKTAIGIRLKKKPNWPRPQNRQTQSSFHVTPEQCSGLSVHFLQPPLDYLRGTWNGLAGSHQCCSVTERWTQLSTSTLSLTIIYCRWRQLMVDSCQQWFRQQRYMASNCFQTKSYPCDGTIGNHKLELCSTHRTMCTQKNKQLTTHFNYPHLLPQSAGDSNTTRFPTQALP